MVIQMNCRYFKGMGEIVWGEYSNKRTAIRVVNELGAPLCTATTNIPHARLEENEVLIKDWSENEGILASLVNAGVVEDTGKTVPSGFVEANVCRLLVQPK